MPYRIKQWWGYKTQLEKVLMAVLAIAILIIIILASAMKNTTPRKPPETCSTIHCLSESLKIMRHTDPKTNPCDDFYQFACGNYSQNSNEQENLPFYLLQKQQVLDFCSEVIHPSDHQIVKLAKRLFQSCVSNTELNKNSSKVLKVVLKEAGGWPVLEGENWDETNFDWKRTAYKFRELGYFHDFFVDVTVSHDRDNNSNYVLEVFVADAFDYRYGIIDIDKVEVMTEMAVIFGAKSTPQVIDDLSKAHDFQQALQGLVYYKQNEEHELHTYSISDYQKLCKYISWLDFINHILGPKIQVTAYQVVRFPPPDIFNRWFDLISKTPKRVQANYIMWTVIERLMPYLSWELQYFKTGLEKKQDHEQLCLEIMSHTGLYYPVQIILNRRYVPVEKKRRLEDLLVSMKVEIRQALHRSTSFNVTNSERAVKILRTLRLEVVPTENYFSDEVLDKLAIDLKAFQNDSFLELLAKARRNANTIEYIKLKNITLVPDRGVLSYPKYSKTENVIYASGLAAHTMYYNEKVPNYINYGMLGSPFGHAFNKLLENILETNQTAISLGKCLSSGATKDDTEVRHWGYLALGQQLSYMAYQEWIKKNGKELPLSNINHTPNQLFWISSASLFCKPIVFHEFYLSGLGNTKTYLLKSVGSNPRFAKDFNCPVESKMYPIVKCTVL